MSGTNPSIPGLTTDQQRERSESLLAVAYRSGITDPKELANFMGQTQHESQNFKRLEENLNYRGSVLWDTFGGNGKAPPRNGLTEKEAHELASIPDRTQRHQAIADKIYGGEWGRRALGNTEEHDGYRYRGRGYIQLTGRKNYEHQSELTGLDLVKSPALAADHHNAERLAVSYWKDSIQVIEGAAISPRAAGSIINTGQPDNTPNGLADRQANAAAWEAALGKEGYLEGVLERHPAAPTATATPSPTPSPSPSLAQDPLPAPAPAPTLQQGALDEPLRLRPELKLSPESLRLLQGSEQQVRQIAERHQLPWDAGLDNTVAAVASQARQDGLSDITHLTVTEGGQIRMAQFDGLTLKESSLDARAAANTDPQRSFGQLAQLDAQQQQQQALQPQQQQQQQPPERSNTTASSPNPSPEAPALAM
jgi:putative chitinase